MPSGKLIRKMLHIAGISGEVAGVDKVATGLYNVLFRVTFSDEPPCIVRIRKFQPSEYSQEFAAERFVYPLLEGSGIRFPKLLYASPDCGVIALPFAIFEFVEHQPLDKVLLDSTLSPERRRGLIVEMAGVLARLHQISAPRFGPLNAATPNKKECRAFVEEVFLAEEERFRRYYPGKAALYRRVVSQWLDVMDDLPLELTSPCLMHGDMHGGNVLVDSSGALVLIDWEACGFGLSFSDLAQLRYFNLRHDAAACDLFIDAYSNMRQLQADIGRIKKAIDIWQCYWQCRIGLFQTQFPAYQDDYHGWASEHLRVIDGCTRSTSE